MWWMGGGLNHTQDGHNYTVTSIVPVKIMMNKCSQQDQEEGSATGIDVKLLSSLASHSH